MFNRREFATLVLSLTGSVWPLRGDTDRHGTPTLGGMQFWTDELIFREWRIQRNVFTGHHRLLDGLDCRFAWGSFEECRDKLERIKVERHLAPITGPVVVLLHGLGRTRESMAGLGKQLHTQGGFTVINFGYASTREEVGQHAEALAKVIGHLDGATEISFVGHSLGNLVTRHFLADVTDPATGQLKDRRFKRMVMLGPPNNGAILAETFGDNVVFDGILGPSGRQLATEWPKLRAKLATPPFEFGIIAGGRGNTAGFNPLFGEDNDAVVSVTTTKLPGARDFLVVPVLHSWLMHHPQVREHTLRFLQNGWFVAPEQRQPIPKS